MNYKVALTRISLLLLVGGGGVGSLTAVQVVRHPYLQAATPDSITIRWRTDSPTASLVAYGLQTNELSSTNINEALTTEHEVRLSDLLPDTRYFYSIGSATQILAGGWDHHFVTAPPAGVAKPTRIWVIGDSGGLTYNYGDPVAVRDAYYQLAGTNRTDVWLALGDNAYEDGTDAEYQTGYFNLFGDLLRQTVAWSTIGNHETYCTLPGKPFPYLDIFSFPTNGEAGGVASGTERYYSFDHGNIHFVCLDSMTQNRASNGPMADWLRLDLRQNTNLWIIAFWHHVPYTKGSHDSDVDVESTEMRQNILPILEAHGVDLVLGGHSHVYERSFLMTGHYGVSATLQAGMILDAGSGREGDPGAYIKPLAGPLANQGGVYVVMGSSSAAEPRMGHHPAMFLDKSQMGSLVLDVHSNRLDARFLRETGQIDDYFTIIKCEPEPLRIHALIHKGVATILRWNSIRGESYIVERASQWVTPDWQSVSEPIKATGTTTSWTNQVSTGETNFFYRVFRMPPPAVLGSASNHNSWTRHGSIVLLRRAQAAATTRLHAFLSPARARPPIEPLPFSEREAGRGRQSPVAVLCDKAVWKRKIKFTMVASKSNSKRPRVSAREIQAASLMPWSRRV